MKSLPTVNPKIAKLSKKISTPGSLPTVVRTSFDFFVTPWNTQIEIHNELEGTVTRLQRENEESRLSRQDTPSISHEPKRSTKLPDPLIFEGRDQDLESCAIRIWPNVEMDVLPYPSPPLLPVLSGLRADTDTQKEILSAECPIPSLPAMPSTCLGLEVGVLVILSVNCAASV
jgi:hypothetical protein